MAEKTGAKEDCRWLESRSCTSFPKADIGVAMGNPNASDVAREADP